MKYTKKGKLNSKLKYAFLVLSILMFPEVKNNLDATSNKKDYLIHLYDYYHSHIPFVDYVAFFREFPPLYSPTKEEMDLYKESILLEFGNLKFDPYGIPLHNYGIEENLELRYNPLFIINYAKNFISGIRSTPDSSRSDPRQVLSLIHLCEWLRKNILSDSNTKLSRISYNFTVRDHKAPWFSAMTQARLANLFLFSYFLFEKIEDLEMAVSLIKTLKAKIEDGGFLYEEVIDGKKVGFYEEYVYPEPTHSYNGHQSVGSDSLEMKDALFVLLSEKPELKDSMLIKELISELDQIITNSVTTLEVVSKYFFDPKSLIFALYKSPGKKIVDISANLYNVTPSYDLVHIEHFIFYIEHGYSTIRPILARYLAYLILRESIDTTSDLLTYIEGSKSSNIVINDRSNFSTILKNKSHGCSNYIYSDDKTGATSFEIQVNGDISGVELLFYAKQWPKLINIKGYSSEGKELFSMLEKEYAPVLEDQPRKQFNFNFPELAKLKFTFDNYTNALQRLVLCDLTPIPAHIELTSSAKERIFDNLKHLFSLEKIDNLQISNDELVIDELTLIIDELLKTHFQSFKNQIYNITQLAKKDHISPILKLSREVKKESSLVYPQRSFPPLQNLDSSVPASQ